MLYAHLSDAEVIAFIDVRRDNERRTVAELVALLAVVEERRIHLARAFSSMFDYCLRGLGLTEKEAQRRITAARLVRRFPTSFDALASGAVCLSSFVLLKDVLTEDNVTDLLARAAGKTQLEVAMIVASLAPKPDVPASITPLLEATQPISSASETTAGGSSAADRCYPPLTPLSPGRYKVELTGNEAFRGKIARALDLTREQNFSGDLLAMFDSALDVFIAHTEKKKRAKTSRPRSAKASKDPGHVVAAARRDVFERDGEQCTFVGANGARCPARAELEIDHKHPRALGGDGTPENLRVLCAPHNLYEEERVFGREHVAKKIAERRTATKRVEVKAREASAHASAPDIAVSDEGATKTRRTVKAALVALGFRAKEVNTTLDGYGIETWERPLEELVRDAIGKLTS